MTTLICNVLTFAIEQHKNQTRKNSKLPYVVHLSRVAGYVAEYYHLFHQFSDCECNLKSEPCATHIGTQELMYKHQSIISVEEMVSIAYLHDILEDTSCTVDQLSTSLQEIITRSNVQEFYVDKNHIIETVLSLTNFKDEMSRYESKAHYIAAKLLRKDTKIETLYIKLCDRLDNVTDYLNHIHMDTEKAQNYANQTLLLLDLIQEKTDTFRSITRRIQETCLSILSQ